MEKISKVFGRHVRERRKQLKMSQEDLAYKLGVSVNFLGQLERGTKQPSLATAEKMAGIIETPLAHLFRKDKEKFAKPCVKDVSLEEALLYHFRKKKPHQKIALINFLKSMPPAKR